MAREPATAAPWLTDEIPGDPTHAGIGFVIDTGSRLPVRFRAGYVTDPDIDELATRCTPGAAGEVVPFPTTHPTETREENVS